MRGVVGAGKFTQSRRRQLLEYGIAGIGGEIEWPENDGSWNHGQGSEAIRHECYTRDQAFREGCRQRRDREGGLVAREETETERGGSVESAYSWGSKFEKGQTGGRV